MEKVLKNENCLIRYDLDKKEIFGQDLTDHYNEPCFYNMNKRIKKGIEALEKEFNNNISMHDAMTILHDNNIKTHYWCAMD